MALIAPAAEPAGELPRPADRPIDYAKDIHPLLARHCYACHGEDVQEGGLRLDQKSAAIAGGDSGPAIAPGKSADSRLIQLVAGTSGDGTVMPPEGQRLTADEIGMLRTWIDQGAAWSDVAPARARGAEHWAFQKPRRPALPAVRQTHWVRNSVDRFVLARLEAHEVKPSAEADRATLIRRLWLDLVGLLPPPDDVARFVADDSPEAYERLVDRLLASPHFGERWGRHWLDLARYADSSGYEFDTPRSVWRYRDWVVDAINKDLPFDQFVVEQLAGDLLPSATVQQTIASGFHCNAMLDPNLRWEAVLDQVNTTGTVFLGLTVGCAQCHSHKFDPLTQREYYRLYAFFDQSRIESLELASPQEKAARDQAQSQVEELRKQQTAYEITLKESLAAWEANLTADERAKLPAPAQAVLATQAGQRNGDAVSQLLTARMACDARLQEMARELETRTKAVPVLPSTLTMRAEPRETRAFIRGNPTRPGEVVSPGVPAFLHPLSATAQPTRLDLARWLVSPENPLLARVAVNRIWQQYFGQGLVETAEDFGVQTPRPEHQELLDWLSAEFSESGWSVKSLHRAIVCSSTYRQSSRVRSDLQSVDPTNRLLARQRRLRVEAEVMRDLALVAGGLMNPTLGGPSVYPHQSDGVLVDRATKATWTVSPGGDRYRRGLYTWIWRLTPHPMLTLFDAPDASAACTRRDRSNTPVQALTMLNDPTFVECARGLARRVIAAGDEAARLTAAYQICFARTPSEQETRVLLALVEQQSAELAQSVTEARQIAGDDSLAPGDAVSLAAWTMACRSLLSVDEFVTRE